MKKLLTLGIILLVAFVAGSALYQYQRRTVEATQNSGEELQQYNSLKAQDNENLRRRNDELRQEIEQLKKETGSR